MRILIAEDDAVSRRLLRGTLEKLGHEVTEAVTGAEALKRFEETEFPIVITVEADGPGGTVRVRRVSGCAGVFHDQSEDCPLGQPGGPDGRRGHR